MKIIHQKDGQLLKTVFVDRDGTINRDCPYCHRPEDLHIYEDTVDLLRSYQDKGYRIIIVTNQSGIGRGYFSLDEFRNFNQAVVDSLKHRGVFVSATYFCPHRPDEGCSCRKPGRGLIDEALSDFRVDMAGSIVIGDREDIDGDLARKVGLLFNLIRH
ncbi:HAD family hydrolase [Thermoplasma sp.]|uniref:HAD family hydrolase n=1 Tax=Thermoplasma sp. TaxID=1973142 RepID=UPI00127A8C6D|nr:HAD family hydrolase [Thermoplasma sp.]KAA8923440.1 MAG: HAD family hydrolase [Thermoplasma sp.]